MSIDKTTHVELSELQAERFVIFQKYYFLFEALIEAKIHELRNAEAWLEFTSDGHLNEVKVKDTRFKRRR